MGLLPPAGPPAAAEAVLKGWSHVVSVPSESPGALPRPVSCPQTLELVLHTVSSMMKHHQPSEDLLELVVVQAVQLDAQGRLFPAAPALDSQVQCGACLEANLCVGHHHEVVVLSC